MIKGERGFILLEFLVAVLLFVVTASMLWLGITQGLKAGKRVEASFRTYDPLRMVFLRMEHDLRNTVTLEDYPFQGGKDEIMFPTHSKELLLIRYFVKDSSLIRSEQAITTHLKDEKTRERVLIKDLKGIEFKFPYEDKNESRGFEPFWVKEPYRGIPRSVQLKLSTPQLTLEKVISIPQGKFGYLLDEKIYSK